MTDRQGQKGFQPSDQELWNRVTKTVTPNPKRGDHVDYDIFQDPDNEGVKGRSSVTQKAKRVSAKNPVISISNQSAPAATLPRLGADTQPGLDRSTAKKLRRGQVAIEGRLDLHGMTQAEAHRALTGFITASQSMGKRCVLVITGKGLARDGSVGVLRTMTPTWLNEPLMRNKVVAFRHAARRHGGEGALYVLLKKVRGS